MTVAYAEEPMMPHQPQKITVQSPQSQHSDLHNSADEQVNGVTGCCVAEKIPGNCADCKPEENEPETFEREENHSADCETTSNMHVTNVELLSETDDAKRVLKNACDFEVQEKILVNRCDETDDVKIERNDENCLASTDCDEKVAESSGKNVENTTNEMCVKSRNAEETENSVCVFDRNENLREGLESAEESSRVEQKFIVVCEPYMVRDSERNALLCNSAEDGYDPEDELNFHEAVRAGDAKSVEKIIARRKTLNLDEPDWNVSGDPPLLVAATNHCLPVLRVLLDNGCDPAVRSPRGETALHRAILNGGAGNVLTFVGELLAYGCPAAVKEAGGGLTALHVLTRQLAHAQGSKSLHHDFQAALKTLELLAKAGPVNAKDHQGRSALHILASSTVFDNTHRTEIESLIKILLDAGADPSLKNDRGETPLHESLECGALNTGVFLTSHTPVGITSRYGETPLHIASRKNYAEMVKILLEHGEDPSVQDAGGNTPLHLASARGFHQTVSLLVTSPLAQLEKTNSDGLTALQVAAESGFVNAVRLLLKAGADPSQTVPYCNTTLHRHPDISVLIDHELTRRRQLAA